MLQLKVPCPTCKRDIEWSEASPFRPFCSERCRLIDLGAWLSEEHAIPGEPAEPQADDTPVPGRRVPSSSA
ncbi:MAG TPA: DNA gyrase inhibitor YacG [Steroidobacteraceae bacterium]|nr:DNA gyrase inhibitor YacG [Steroidobacteraceae bacterium]